VRGSRRKESVEVEIRGRVEMGRQKEVVRRQTLFGCAYLDIILEENAWDACNISHGRHGIKSV
jgi:hypothetical protein